MLYAQRLDEFHAEIEPACREVRQPEELFVLIATKYLDVYRVYGRELNIWSVLLREQNAANNCIPTAGNDWSSSPPRGPSAPACVRGPSRAE